LNHKIRVNYTQKFTIYLTVNTNSALRRTAGYYVYK